MTAATITRTPLMEHLADLLDCYAKGNCPPDFCADCVAAIADRCDRCAELAYRFEIFNAAIGNVQQAPDDAAAHEVYTRTTEALAAASAGVQS
jgi:hypothetical protein